jgi:hypothetical protein
MTKKSDLNHVRNYTDIEHQKVRQHIDPHITKLHDELEIAYYKHWKFGISHDFYGYNVLPTIEECKDQFDRLHGLLFCLHKELLREQNVALDASEQYEELKQNYTIDVMGIKWFKKTTEEMRKLKEQSADSLVLKQAFISKVKDDEKLNTTVSSIKI